MFRSLSHQLFGGSQDKNYEVRSLLIRFESKNFATFASLLTEINEPDMSSHIKKMLRPGVWGTHLELFAASTYFQIPLYILKHSSDNQCKWEILRPLGSIDKFNYQLCPAIDTTDEDFSKPDHFELLHSCDCHYDSITAKDGTSLSRPKIIETHIDCTDVIL